METITPPKPQSLRSYVEHYLRQAILAGKYKAGDRLVEREICEILNVSRPPVREALRQLEADKLISNELHRGPIVSSMSYKEAEELYKFRALLESFAVAEFSRLATDEQINDLSLAIKKLHEVSDKGDKNLLLSVKADLYDVILSGCGNQLVRESLLKLLDRVSLLRGTSLVQPNRMTQSLKEIDQMFKCIKSRNYEAAKDAAYNHIQAAAKVALAVIAAEQK